MSSFHEAIRLWFSRSPHALTADQFTGLDEDHRMLLFLEECMRFAALSGRFMQEANSVRTPGSAVDVRFVLASP